MAFIAANRPPTGVHHDDSRFASRTMSRAMSSRSTPSLHGSRSSTAGPPRLNNFRTSLWADPLEDEVDSDEDEKVWRPQLQKGRLAPKLTKGQAKLVRAKKEARSTLQYNIWLANRPKEHIGDAVMHVPEEGPNPFLNDSLLPNGMDPHQRVKYWAPPSLATFGMRDLNPIKFQGDVIHEPKYQQDWGNLYTEQGMKDAVKLNPMHLLRPRQRWDDVTSPDYEKNLKSERHLPETLPSSAMGVYGWEVGQMKRSAFAPPKNRKPVMDSFSTTWANSMLHRNHGVSPFSKSMRGGGK